MLGRVVPLFVVAMLNASLVVNNTPRSCRSGAARFALESSHDFGYPVKSSPAFI
jgi:hypothetical protein